MKYINKYLEYLKVVKKYSDKTIESYYDDLTLTESLQKSKL